MKILSYQIAIILLSITTLITYQNCDTAQLDVADKVRNEINNLSVVCDSGETNVNGQCVTTFNSCSGRPHLSTWYQDLGDTINQDRLCSDSSTVVTDVFQVLVKHECRDGGIHELAETRQGSVISAGVCAEDFSSCGDKAHEQTWWETNGDKITPIICSSGSAFNTYARAVEYVCNDGQTTPTGNEEFGILKNLQSCADEPSHCGINTHGSIFYKIDGGFENRRTCQDGSIVSDFHNREVQYLCNDGVEEQTGKVKASELPYRRTACPENTADSCGTRINDEIWYEANGEEILVDVNCAAGSVAKRAYVKEVERKCVEGRVVETGNVRSGALVRHGTCVDSLCDGLGDGEYTFKDLGLTSLFDKPCQNEPTEFERSEYAVESEFQCYGGNLIVTEHTQIGDLLRVVNECTSRTCGLDVYLVNDTCTPVGNGYFSSVASAERFSCSTRPSNSTYTTSGGGVDNCSWVCNSGYFKDQNECVAVACNANSVESCSVVGGQGTMTCKDDGSGFDQCEISSCDTDYYKEGEACTPVAIGEYSPNDNVLKYDCQNKPAGSEYTTTGGGQNNCSWQCNTGYFLIGQTCVAQTCNPGTTRVCEVANGSGVATCNAQGSEFGACSINNCGVDFYLNGGTCSPVSTGEFSPSSNISKFSCTNKPVSATYTSTGNGSNSCDWTCNSGFFKSGNLCRPQLCSPNQKEACSVPNGEGEKTCSSNGDQFGACVTTGCGLDYYLNGVSCVKSEIGYYSPVSNTNNIACSNGPANSLYTSRGNGANNCQWSCAEGFFQSGSQCLPRACEANSTINCSVNYGSGVRTCNSEGSGYGSCFVDSCDIDFFLDQGVCKNVGIGAYSPANNKNRISCSNKPAGSTYTTSGNGSNSCAFTCNPGYFQSGQTCTVHACTPGTDSSCSVSNGNGLKECKVDGSGYNSCEIAGCGIDFYLNGGYCQAVGVGYYSPDLNKTKISCTNKPTNSRYSSSGSGFNNCGWTCNTGFYKSGNSCIPQICSPGSDSICSISNGNGVKECNDLGSGFGACEIAGCGIDFYLNGGTCRTVGIGQYSPNQNKSVLECTNKPPYARYTSSGNGTNNCQWSCNDGYYRSENVCRPHICQPGQDSSCAVTNGNGLKTCDALGSSYGNCEVAGCNLDFFLNGRTCVAVAVGKYSPAEDKQRFNCSNRPFNSSYTSTGNGTNNCEWSCNSGFYQSGNSCVAQACSPGSVSTCAIAGGSGEKVCNNNGSAYGSCVASGCDIDYFLTSGACRPVGIGAYSAAGDKTKRLCTNKPSNSVYTSSGNGRNSCLWSCEGGFNQSGNSCIEQVCSAGSKASCSVEGGTGEKTCGVNGAGYGSCQPTGCNLDHYLTNGQCRPVGVGSYSPAGDTARRSCTNRPSNSAYTSVGFGTNNCSWSCDSGFNRSGNTCVAQICSPGIEVGCAISNGTGRKVCNDFGNAYSSCTLNTCNTGYNKSGNSCVAQTCSPDSTASCSFANGTGEKTCNASGTAYSSCNVKGCDLGYFYNNGACKPVFTGYYSANGQTAQTYCSNKPANSDYTGGATGINNCPYACENGFARVGNTCVAQVCNANSVAGCSFENGSGEKTCNATGTAYSSCRVKGCDLAYFFNNGICKPVFTGFFSAEGETAQTYCSNKPTNADYTAGATGIDNCPWSCRSGFYQSGNNCIAQICAPGAEVGCAISNGTGQKTCDSQGKSFSSCSIASCNSGYHQSGNTCVQSDRLVQSDKYESHADACARVGGRPATSGEICISGERRPSSIPSSWYIYGTFGGTSHGGTYTERRGSKNYCYSVGQKEDYDGSDKVVGWMCSFQ